jgi:hypothetical protein
MDVEPSIQTLETNCILKEEEFDELLADDAADDSSDFEDDVEDPNEFKIRDPLPAFREYKRKLSEVHSKPVYMSSAWTSVLTPITIRNGPFQ